MRDIPAPLELYRHFKGNIYQIICIARHSETEEKMVIYQALYGDYPFYARPLDMFLEEVDHDKYPEVKQKYRFEKISAQTVRQENERGSVKAADTDRQTADSADGREEAGAEEQLNPRVIAFLDARTYEEKLTILAGMKDSLTNHMLDMMSAAEDIEIKPGSIEERYEELKNCLVTLDHFECSRLR